MRQKMTSSGNDEKRECPLCMEMIDFDDLNFYPCQCRYQVCRFCWYRLINEENGLCPNCRKRYNSEEPALFKPATEEEVARRKRDRKLQEQQKKRRTADNRKHLADVRVLQRNLVFVMNLPLRLNDKEVLKGNEYFGKYGKVFKVILNKNVSANNQNQPTISAYVTYLKMEDALRAVVELNRLHIDSRHLKASLGTTKYCTQFLKGLQCTKHECMYLHEMGDDAASFTKEEMTMGKHTEYELRLIEQFQSSQPNNHTDSSSSTSDKAEVLKSSDNNAEPPRTPQNACSMGSTPSPVSSPSVSTAPTPSISSQILNSAVHFPPPSTISSLNNHQMTGGGLAMSPLTGSSGADPLVDELSASLLTVASNMSGAVTSNDADSSGKSLDSCNLLGFGGRLGAVMQSSAAVNGSFLFSHRDEESVRSLSERISASKDDAPSLDFDPVREAQQGLALEMESEGKMKSQQALQHQEYLDQQLSNSLSSFWPPTGGLSGRSSSTSYMSPCSPLPPHSPAVGVSPSRGGQLTNSLFTQNPQSMSPLSNNFDMSHLHGSLPQSPPVHSQVMSQQLNRAGGGGGMHGNGLMQTQRMNSYPGLQTPLTSNNSSFYSQQISMQMARSAQQQQQQHNHVTFNVNNTNKNTGLNWAFVPPPSSKDPSCTIDFEATRYFSPNSHDALSQSTTSGGQSNFGNGMQRNFGALYNQNCGDVYDQEQSSHSMFGSPSSSSSNRHQQHPFAHQLQNNRNQFNGAVHESPMSSNSIWNMGSSSSGSNNQQLENGGGGLYHHHHHHHPTSPHTMLPLNPSSHNFSNSSPHSGSVLTGNNNNNNSPMAAYRGVGDSSFNGFAATGTGSSEQQQQQNNFLASSQHQFEEMSQNYHNIPGSVRSLSNLIMSDTNSSNNFRMFPAKF